MLSLLGRRTMENDFMITELCRVVTVKEEEEFTELRHSFARTLEQNELIFHFSGKATVFFDNLTLQTEPNTIRFLPQGTAERYDVHLHTRGECIDVFFRTDRPLSSHAFVENASRNEKIGGLFKKLFATWMSKSEGYYFASVSLLYRILAEMQKESRTPKSHEKKIAPALSMILDGFLKNDLSVCELAAACHMSETYFQKLFKERYGVSPKKYIIQLKINHACDLLSLGRYSVTQIAEMCRFSDVYFFSRQFKEYVGTTPTKFAQKGIKNRPK